MKKLLFALIASALLPSAASALCPVPTGVSAQTGVYNLMPDSQGGISVGQYGNLEGGERRREGTFYYDSANKKMMLCNGTDWMSVLATSAGGGGDTGTSGTAVPSKKQIYGPYDIPGDTTQTLAAIANNPASSYTIYGYIQLTGTTSSGLYSCSLEAMVNGTWVSFTSLQFSGSRSRDDGNWSYSYSSSYTPGTARAELLSSGQYRVVLGDLEASASKEKVGGGSNYGHYVPIPAANPPKVVTGGFPGKIRANKTGPCDFQVIVEVRNDG